MKTKDPISQQIKETREKRGLTSTQLADLLKVPVDRLYKWEHGKASPKYDDRKKIHEWINGKPENVSSGTSEDQNDIEKMHVSAVNNSSLQSLIISNVALAKAALVQAERDKVKAEADKIREEKEKMLVESNLNLASMLKTTEHVPEDNPLAHPSVLSKLLETLAELGIGSLWETKEDGLIALGNRLSLPEAGAKNKAGSQAGVGKKSTAKQ